MQTRAAHPVARAFQDAVAEIAQREPLTGAILASRDGLLVANAALHLPQPEVFCAMHAAALGAAEMALRDIGAAGVSLIADTGGQRFVSRAVNRSLFVVAMVGPDADCHAVCAWMDGLGARLGPGAD